MSSTAITVEQSWSAIDQLTHAMRTAANAEEWSNVLELSGSRHQRLMQHFEQFPVGPGNAEFYQQHLTSMLNGEKELQRLATDARREVMREGLITNKNHRAIGAYLS